MARSILLVGGLILFVLTPAHARTLQVWTFEDGLQGWQPNGHLTEVEVKEGILRGRATDWDPFFTLTGLRIPASPWQVIEVRLKADRSGRAEFFWTNTTQSPYGGFMPGKQTPFEVLGDGEWRVYRLQPFWQREGTIIQLRFDLFDGLRFEVDEIRIVEPDVLPEPVVERRIASAESWAFREGMEKLESGRLRATSRQARLIAPPVAWPTEETLYATVRMRVTRGERGTVFAAVDRHNGLRETAFRLQPDGAWHTYNVALGGGMNWEGNVIYFALQPTDAPGAEVELGSVSVGPEPGGPADIVLRGLGFEAGILRAGVPVPVVARLFNQGGGPASNVRATLRLGPGLRRVEGEPTQRLAQSLEALLDDTLRWRVEATQAGERWVEVELRAAGQPLQRRRVNAVFTPRVSIARTGYVPEPQPVSTPYQIGVYYFPGWNTASRWAPIRPFPERTPVLGWYREGDPEVADWHIKWAVEHGISFFIYDWYWVQGARMLEHALHDGFFQARYQHLLKFCLLWANHNPDNTSSEEDLLAVTDFWIEHYFRRPNHLQVDGKPLVVIFSPYRLRADMGSEAVRTAFDKMRARCRQAGFQGLYLVACGGGSPAEARQLAAEGYDAVSGYNWPAAGMRPEDGMRAPFRTVLDGYRENWNHLVAEGGLALIPPVCGGWDSRPWHGDTALTRYGRTPELFRQHLMDVKALLDNPPGPAGSLPYRMAFIEAWNEWGEGSYIEPHQEYGFGYLDAIRAVFTAAPSAHTDVAPVDVGLGPYDVPPVEYRHAWDFEDGSQGWDAMMQLSTPTVEQGALVAVSQGTDPAFFGPPMQLPARRYPVVRIRMRANRDDTAQLFWTTTLEAESEATSERFRVIGDGQFHDYVLDLRRHPRWRGIVTRLRLDPGTQPGFEVAVDEITCEEATHQ